MDIPVRIDRRFCRSRLRQANWAQALASPSQVLKREGLARNVNVERERVVSDAV